MSVIAGVLAENWDDFGMFYAHPNWVIGRVAVGGVVVAVGIALEIWFSSRSSSAERKIRDWYAIKVAELNLRAETEQVARVKLELELEKLRSPRTISAPAYKELRDLLPSHAGKAMDIVVFDHHVPETLFFANQLVPLFVNAGWKCRQWESRKATYRIKGNSTLVATGNGHELEFEELSLKLTGVLKALGIECGTRPGAFACAEFVPGDFDLIFEHPRQVFGRKIAFPFRIQICAKQLIELPSRVAILTRHTPPEA